MSSAEFFTKYAIGMCGQSVLLIARGQELNLQSVCIRSSEFVGSIVYKRAKVYLHKIFSRLLIVHVITIDQ